MLKNIVNSYLNTCPQRRTTYDEQHAEKLCRQQLVRGLFDWAENNKIVWSVRGKFALAEDLQGSSILIQELPQTFEDEYKNRFFYNLTVTEHGEIRLSLLEKYERKEYTESDALRGTLPLVDLYDLAVRKERRHGRVAHVCGLQGFRYGSDGDVCPACSNQQSSLGIFAKKLPY